MTNISHRPLWFFIADFLQVNWAVVQPNIDGATILFFDSKSHVFDRLECESIAEAEAGLRRNLFDLYDNDLEAQEFIPKPTRSLIFSPRHYEEIYSSGSFWK